MRIINTHRESVPPDNPRTAEEIRDLCCSEVPFDICAKSGRVSTYTGAEKEDWDFDPDAALEQARADNPGKRILAVRTEGIGPPPGQPCGKKYEKWTGKNNCCDFVEPIAWDSDNSSEIIAPGSAGLVVVTGGVAPYYWSVRGQDMTFDNWNMRDAVTDVPYIYVYAGSSACGWAPITVTDGCSVVADGVRVTLGKWIRRPDLDGACPGIAGEIIEYSRVEAIAGRLKYLEVYLQGSVSGGGVGTCEEIRTIWHTQACNTYNPTAPRCLTLNLPNNPLCPEKMYVEADNLYPTDGGCTGVILYRVPHQSNPSQGVYTDTMVYEWVCP